MIESIREKYWDTLYKIMTSINKSYEAAIKSYGLRIECCSHNDNEEWYTDKAENGKYRLIIGEKTVVAFWELWQMKNCCGICVSTASEVGKNFRKRGLGTILNQIRIDYAKGMGYGLLLCTDVTSNKPQQKILTKNGWDKICEFKNPRTGNEIGIHVVSLT